MTDLGVVRLLLMRWGRWAKARGIGYPAISAHESLHLGVGVFDGGPLPPDIEAVDLAVSRAEPQHKLIVVEHYTKAGTVREHAARLRLRKSTYFDRLNTAELRITRLLT